MSDFSLGPFFNVTSRARTLPEYLPREQFDIWTLEPKWQRKCFLLITHLNYWRLVEQCCPPCLWLKERLLCYFRIWLKKTSEMLFPLCGSAFIKQHEHSVQWCSPPWQLLAKWIASFFFFFFGLPPHSPTPPVCGGRISVDVCQNVLSIKLKACWTGHDQAIWRWHIVLVNEASGRNPGRHICLSDSVFSA